MKQLVCSGGIPAFPRNTKLSEFRSDQFIVRKNALNSVHTMEQYYKQTLGIPFSTFPWKKILVRILFRERKIEANSIPNHCAEEKTTRNTVPRKKIDKNSRNSVPKHFEVRTNHFVKLFGCFLKLFFFPTFFRSELQN